ncbi:MAG: Asp-tRNA(Asn)/Glu-tRNA(Gln) amidotransferase subunit GatC [Bdellovibrionota bacterium]
MTSSFDIAKIARLARIELREGDEARLTSRLEKILASFAALQDVDVAGADPLYSLSEEIVLREDVPEPALDRDKILVNAPNSFDGCYRVGRVVRSE